MKEIYDFIKLMNEKYNGVPKFVHNNFADNVYYSGPYFDERELHAILETIMLGSWFPSGEQVQKFEKEFSKKFNVKHSVMVNSGSSANLLMIAALKKHFSWKDDDEIILSVVGFPTTLSPLLVNNLKPIFVDIEYDTLNFDLIKIKEKMTPKTRAIFVSPVLGNPPNFDELISISEEYGVELILDNCDSLGSKWKERYLNEYCVASSCSFYPAHHITTGEGGMISSNNPKIIKIARSMSMWGRDCTCVGTENLLHEGSCKNRFAKWLPEQDIVLDHKYIFSNLGYNLKPLDFQGAIGLVQLEKLEEIIEKRIIYKTIIQVLLEKYVKDIQVINSNKYAFTSWFGVPVVCKNKKVKEKLVKHLEDNKIQTRNYFAGNILLHPAYEHLDNWKYYIEANKVLENVFFLGCSPTYTQKHIDYIEKVLKEL